MQSIQAAVRGPVRRSERHDDGALRQSERLLESVLGLGRRGRRHGQPGQVPQADHLALPGQRGALHDAIAQEGPPESQSVPSDAQRRQALQSGRPEQLEVQATRFADEQALRAHRRRHPGDEVESHRRLNDST